MIKSKSFLLGLSAIFVAALTLFFFKNTNHLPSQKKPQEAAANLATSAQIENFEQALENWASIEDQQSLAALAMAAENRRPYMRQLMVSEPTLALEYAVSYSEYAALPPRIQNLVERPFSQKGEIEILIICDENQVTPEYILNIRLDDGVKATLSLAADPRVSMTKRNVPIQGIQLDEIAVARPTVFQTLENEDMQWALEILPLANDSLNIDFLTGETFDSDPLIAIAGGVVFAFQDANSLNQIETTLRSLDNLPGMDVGSSVLLATFQRNDSGGLSLDQVVQAAKEISAAATLSTKKYLIIRVDFPDNEGSPYTASEMKSLVESSVAPALANFSYNKTTVTPTVTDSVYRLSSSGNYTIDKDLIHTDAVTAYIADGNSDPASEYDFVAVLFPELGFSWAGIASVGGYRQWLHNKVNDQTVTHELGHNYGLGHASYWVFDNTNPNSTNPVDPTGASETYGDPYDVMGEGPVGTSHFHMAAKQSLGWLENDQWLDLSGPADNGVYRIYGFDAINATGVQGLRIAKSASSDHYWVGHRMLYPGVPNFANGAYLVWERSSQGLDNNRSWLVDTTPNSPDGKVDAGISIGRTYNDTASGVFITPTSSGQNATGRYIDIAVNFGTFSGNQSPSGTLNAPSSGAARMPVSFSVSATDPDNDELAYSWDFGDGIIEQSLTTIDHSFPVGGSYDVSVTISDRKGGTTVLQSSISISDPINNLNTRSSGTSQQLLALAANDSLIVASGDNGIFLYSNDGTTWNSFTVSGSIINLSINDIIWTGTEFIAVGANHNGNWIGVVFSSSDGKTWAKDFQTTAAIGDFGFLSVAANADASAIIAVGSDAKLYKRTAINNWSVVDWTLPENSNVNRFAAIAFGDGYFVAGGYNFAPPQTLILQRSSNGETWTNLVPDSGIQEQGHGLDTIEYLNGTFLGSGFTSRVRYSTDSGETWQTNQLGEVHRMSSFAYGNGIYSAHGTNFNDTPLDLLSTDGRNWKIVTAPTQALNDRIFFNNTFISVGDAGLILQTDSFLPPDQRGFTAWIIGFIQSGNGQGANANPDQDWAPNFLEYALGSNPSDPTSAPTPPSLTRDEQGRITISIHRFEKTDVLLTLEKSTDLTAWTPLAATADTDTESLLELVSDDSFNSSLPLFIRIKASQQ